MSVPNVILGLILLVAGLSALLGGLNLSPTDLGLTFYLMGATLFTGAMIVFAIGFAARGITRAVNAQNEATAIASTSGPMNAPQMSAPEPRNSGTMLGAGAAVAAGAAIVASRSEPAATIPLDAFERELFAESPVEAPPAPAVDSPLVKGLELPSMPDIAEFRLDPPLFAEAPVASPISDAATEVEPVTELTPSNEEASEDAPKSEPAATEPAASAPISGLIADEDTAAIAAEGEGLAPIDTLDVVGSYDSGGTRFTMYSDGSVTAAGPDGEQRFPSLDALRKHIDR